MDAANWTHEIPNKEHMLPVHFNPCLKALMKSSELNCQINALCKINAWLNTKNLEKLSGETSKLIRHTRKPILNI